MHRVPNLVAWDGVWAALGGILQKVGLCGINPRLCNSEELSTLAKPSGRDWRLRELIYSAKTTDTIRAGLASRESSAAAAIGLARRPQSRSAAQDTKSHGPMGHRTVFVR